MAGEQVGQKIEQQVSSEEEQQVEVRAQSHQLEECRLQEELPNVYAYGHLGVGACFFSHGGGAYGAGACASSSCSFFVFVAPFSFRFPDPAPGDVHFC